MPINAASMAPANSFAWSQGSASRPDVARAEKNLEEQRAKLDFKPTAHARPDIQKAEAHLLKQRENNITMGSEGGKLTGEMVLGKVEDWIKLLVATMKNQNPDEPIKGTEIATQFNAFGQTLGILEIKRALEGYTKLMNTDQILQAAAQLDKMVEVAGAHFFYSPHSPCELKYTMPEGTEKATIIITDDQNRVVTVRQIAAQPGENNTMKWDGKDSQGNVVKSGKYIFRVSAIDQMNNVIKDENGHDVVIPTSVVGRVTGGTIKNNTAYLKVNGGDYALSSMIAIQSVDPVIPTDMPIILPSATQDKTTEINPEAQAATIQLSENTVSELEAESLQMTNEYNEGTLVW